MRGENGARKIMLWGRVNKAQKRQTNTAKTQTKKKETKTRALFVLKKSVKKQRKTQTKRQTKAKYYPPPKSPEKANRKWPKGLLLVKTARRGQPRYFPITSLECHVGKNFVSVSFFKEKIDQSEFFKTKSKQIYWSRIRV